MGGDRICIRKPLLCRKSFVNPEKVDIRCVKIEVECLHNPVKLSDGARSGL